MDRFLAADVYAAFVGPDLVLLDVRGDRYLCVPGAQGRLAADGARLRLEDPQLAAELAAAGLVAGAPSGARIASRPCPRPARDLPTAGASTTLELRDAAEIARAVADAAGGYAGRSLAALLRAARGGPAPEPDPGPRLSAVARAQAFRRWAPFAPLPSKCLLRAFLLRRCLRRAGHDVAWVFGVKTWPFEAHCWIQSGDMVLDDSWERLAVFEPLLAV